MAGRMKEESPTNREAACKVVIEMPGRAKKSIFVPARHLQKLEAFLEKYGGDDSVLWEDLVKDRISRYKKSGLALRGARYREGLSQKELAERTGISQENVSRMENGKRAIGKQVAKKLAKALCIDIKLFSRPTDKQS